MMFVLVNGDSVTLEEVEDLKRLHVELRTPATDAELGELLQANGFGYADERGFFVDLARIRARSTDLEGVEKMVDYARGKGWLSADGTALEAHVERRY
ncbi:hypothetical protein ABH922_000565 [Rhodococcus sp. 27YEA15]|uniref:hypothetical protein n=1 Tax=Rhodococcus sp. 27YEA15 TaxID=3156259 RepID=UPI003C7ADFFF